MATRVNRCNLLQQIGWEKFYGTTSSGNLPQYRPDINPCAVDVSLITMPGVEERDFKYYHHKCPYSDESEAYNYIMDRNVNSPTYGEYVLVPVGQRTEHTATTGVMIRWSRGSKHGWLCPDDACYFYATLQSGQRYFYL